MSENVLIALIGAIAATLASIGGIVVSLIGMYKHRHHEATSDNTNAQLTVLLNGGLETRIDKAVKKHIGSRVK